MSKRVLIPLNDRMRHPSHIRGGARLRAEGEPVDPSEPWYHRRVAAEDAEWAPAPKATKKKKG